MPEGRMTDAKPRGLLLVMIEVDPAHEADFNRWYSRSTCPSACRSRGS